MSPEVADVARARPPLRSVAELAREDRRRARRAPRRLAVVAGAAHLASVERSEELGALVAAHLEDDNEDEASDDENDQEGPPS